MVDGKDYLGEKLRLLERAREDHYFRKLDQELLAKMRQAAAEEASAAENVNHPDRVFTSILIPVDFSAYSTQALHLATDLAARFNASLIVLHVIAAEVGAYALATRLGKQHFLLPGVDEPIGLPDISDGELDTAIAHHRGQAYEALQTFIPPRMASYSVELRVLFGQPFERILETAVGDDVGLIVMGTHGRTGLARMTAGSVAERVVRLAPCPVLTVKAAISEPTN